MADSHMAVPFLSGKISGKQNPRPMTARKEDDYTYGI